MLKILNKIFLFLINITWCLPQNLLGAIIWLYLKLSNKFVKRVTYVEDKSKRVSAIMWTHPSGCMSLGKFIFLSKIFLEDDYKDEAPDYLSHEYGHTIQSYILGPLYLLVIGLPSILWCGWISNWKCNQDKSYYWFYSEKWATYLGLKYLDPLLLKEV